MTTGADGVPLLEVASIAGSSLSSRAIASATSGETGSSNSIVSVDEVP